MDPLFILAVIALAAGALYLMLARPTKAPPRGGRPDETERPELTGPEQHKRRKQP